MTETQQWVTVLIVSAGLILTRFIIFWLFPPSKKPPASIEYLGKVLPAAAIALVLVYSLKDTEFLTFPYGLPEIIGILVVVFVHKWRRNTLLSVAAGTIIYMFLIQFVFVLN
jgi:branched-subunit amino acid transport protein AzlD